MYYISGLGVWNLLFVSRLGIEGLEDWFFRRGFDVESDEDSRFEDENVFFRLSSISRSWAEEEGESCLREGTAYLDEDVIFIMLGDLE